MNTQEIISSGILESYVLGTATSEEVAAVNAACKKDPEVLKEIEKIEESLVTFSGKIAGKIPHNLKDKIATQLSFKNESGDTKVINIVPEKEKIRFYKFGIAASLLLFATSLFYNILMQQKLHRVNDELAELSQSRSYMAEELQIQKTSLNKMSSQINVIAHPSVKTIALEGMNDLKGQSAMVHWNKQTQEVYFNAHLPALAADKQYQLWAMVAGKPVDMGMISMEEKDSLFLKMKTTGEAEAFAVTIEKAGGSVAPTMEAMCLMGKV